MMPHSGYGSPFKGATRRVAHFLAVAALRNNPNRLCERQTEVLRHGDGRWGDNSFQSLSFRDVVATDVTIGRRPFDLGVATLLQGRDGFNGSLSEAWLLIGSLRTGLVNALRTTYCLFWIASQGHHGDGRAESTSRVDSRNVYQVEWASSRNEAPRKIVVRASTSL